MLNLSARTGFTPLFLTSTLAAAALSACSQPKLNTGTFASGSLALSSDGKTLYVADDDNNNLLIIDPVAQSVKSTVAVGTQPTNVIVASDGRVFVSNRQSRSVSVVDPTKSAVVATIAVGTEPTGMAFSTDGKTLVVANTTNSNVSIVDVESLTVRTTVATDPDPSGVSVVDNEAWVTHIREGAVTRIDLSTPGQEKVVAGGTFALGAPTVATGGTPRLPGQPLAPVLAVNGSGTRFYVVHSQSVNQAVATTPTSQDQQQQMQGGGGATYAGIPNANGLPSAIVAPALATIDVSSHTLLLGADAQAASNNGGPEEGEGVASPTTGPQFVLTPSVNGSMPNLPAQLKNVITASDTANIPPFLLTVANQAMSGPSAAIIDSTGSYLFITNKNSNNVAIVQTSPGAPNFNNSDFGGAPVPPEAPGALGVLGPPTLGFGMQQVISVGAGPTGIAIPSSNDRVYVYSSFDHTVSIITANGGKTADTESARFSVGTSPLSPEADTGRRLFFSAADPRMTSDVAGGIACASCHPSGRDDGRTWTFTEGPRNTPSLAGRDLAGTAPYHWDGLITDMHAFNTVITNRMGGAGDGTSANGPAADGSVLADSDFTAIQVFLDSQAAPDNPFKIANNPAAVAAGQKIFATTAGCAQCHTGADFTDNQFHNVGTMVNETPGDQDTGAEQSFFTANSTPGVNTPTLRNIFASAPYLHDGSDADLMARINDDRGGLHGTTTSINMSDADKQNLLAYLQTL